MRINTTGSKDYRERLYERTAERLNERNKSAAIDGACEHVRRDIENKQEVMNYLVDELPAGKLERVAEILDTDQIPVTAETEVNVGNE
jgi:uncharacterized protein YwlG (UPF0340 family)